MIVSTILSSVTGFHRRHSNETGRNAEVTMETEVRTLKQELARTQEALKAATKRCRDLVRELDNRVASHESERTLRDQQLSRILRALLVLEARLKQEQKSIRQLLSEKDNMIRNQQLEIARLRRYTKNYIKCKRDPTLGRSSIVVASNNIESSSLQKSTNIEAEIDTRQDTSISKDIQNLKCEIITKLNPSEVPIVLDSLDRGVKKTHSFAGSDISKTSLTSSENTDVSIITTTTEGSPSLLSTEGFCEGESTDVSPGSTLNKSSRCTPTTVTDSENETTMIYDDDDEEETMIADNGSKFSKRKPSIGRSKTQKVCKPDEPIETTHISRAESKDDGMDCNFVSEDEEKEQEPIYVNACNENSPGALQHTDARISDITETNEDYGNNNATTDNSSNNNNNNTIPTKLTIEEQNVEETSGNWYSDPDEDRISDEVFRHSTYRPNSNHNSVLECVNQILLRDMEEEENVLSIPRRFKHRGRIVRFQPARLSDIESVGSEMERKNSEETTMEKEAPSGDFDNVPVNSFEPTASEDEFGMRISQPGTNAVTPKVVDTEPDLEAEPEESKAIPIVIIEPKVEIEESNHSGYGPSALTQINKAQGNATSPPLKLERIEEKTCLQMSAKRLTIAKNLDYEDIESLPDVISPPPKTPPALPPKPQFRNNTLILKKIPSPSFLINETKKKQQQQMLDPGSIEHGKKIFGFLSSPIKTSTITSVRSLNFDDTHNKASGNNEGGNFWRNRFNNVRSSFQARQNYEAANEQMRKIPRVTNIVRHFEEFKIGGEADEQSSKERSKLKEKHVHSEFEQDFDIRQNFEEFNLDECDLSDDAERREEDASERLGNLGAVVNQSEKAATTKDNNNVPLVSTNSNSGYDHFLEATGLSNKSILTPSRLLSNHKSMLKPKDVKYKNKIKATAVLEKHGVSTNNTTHVKHWTGPFV